MHPDHKIKNSKIKNQNFNLCYLLPKLQPPPPPQYPLPAAACDRNRQAKKKENKYNPIPNSKGTKQTKTDSKRLTDYNNCRQAGSGRITEAANENPVRFVVG